MGSPRYKRNRRLKCGCGGYHFPHRKGGGACDHSKTRDIHHARRSGSINARMDASIDYWWQWGGIRDTLLEAPF